MSGPPPADGGVPFRFERHDRVRIDGRDYVYLRPTGGGHVLRLASGDFEETLAHEDLASAALRQGFQHDRRFYAEGNVNARARSGIASLNDLPPEEIPKVLFKYEFCVRFLRQEALHGAKRSDASLTAVIPLIAATMFSDAAKGAKLAGQTIASSKPPCAKTLRTWVVALEDGGLEPTALREGTRLKGNRIPRLDPEVHALLTRHARGYMSEKKPTVETLHENLEVELSAVNRKREAGGLAAHPVPSIRPLRLMVKGLPAFEVYASRNGLDAARRHFNLVKGSPDAMRPGERVEIDEWTINLQKILTQLGLWHRMGLAERKAWTGRRLACVAIDVATRCVLGMRIGATATGDLARETLRMAVADKSAIAAAAGAKSPWDMRLTPDLVVSDGGSAFVGSLFAQVVADLGSARDVAKCKMPHLRGTIERFFRTADVNLLARFTGRSFESISEKGDYDSEARASLTEEDLAWALVRWVVDQYHNTPHDGLGGETPRNAWLRLGRHFGVRPPPGRDKTLAVFGARLTRRLSMRGVRFLGNHYSCPALADDIMANHLHEVAIRVDEEDLGQLSVQIGGAWHLAPCVDDGFDGVSAATWLAALAELRRRFAREDEMTRPVVLEAIAAIEARAERAERSVGIVSLAPAAERIASAEREIVGTFGARPANAGPSRHGKERQDESDDPFDGATEVGDVTGAGDAEEAGGSDEPRYSSEDE